MADGLPAEKREEDGHSDRADRADSVRGEWCPVRRVHTGNRDDDGQQQQHRDGRAEEQLQSPAHLQAAHVGRGCDQQDQPGGSEDTAPVEAEVRRDIVGASQRDQRLRGGRRDKVIPADHRAGG